MEDGPYRARRPTGGRRRASDDPEDILARHGLLGADPDVAPSGGRAARRRAAEEDHFPAYPVTDGGRHTADTPSERPEDVRRYRADDARSGPRSAAAPDEPGGRRYRAEWDDETNGHRSAAYDSIEHPRDQHRNGYAPTGEPPIAARPTDAPSGRRHLRDTPFDADPLADPWADRAGPSANGGRRRAPEAIDAPDADDRWPPPGRRSDSAAPRRHPDPADEGTRGSRRGRRRLPDDPNTADDPASADRRHDPVEPADAPATAGRRRRRLEPPDDLDFPPATSHRQGMPEPMDPSARRRLPDDLNAPAATAFPEDQPRSERWPPADADNRPRRRRIDPTDDPDVPAAGHRPGTAEPAGTARPWTADAPAGSRRGFDPAGPPADARGRRTHVTDTGPPAPAVLPRNGATRRRHLDPTEYPDLPAATGHGRGTREPVGTRPWTADDPDAPAELPSETRGRRTRPTDAGLPAPAVLPRNGATGRRHLDPTDDPDIPATTGPRRPSAETAGTTALPRAGGTGRRHLDPTDDPDIPATTGPRRRTAEPIGTRPWTTDDPDPPAARRRGGPERTELPAGTRGRRTRPTDTGESATTALPVTGRPGRRGLDPDDDAAEPIGGRGADGPDTRRRRRDLVPPADDDPDFSQRTHSSATTALPAAARRRPRKDADAPDSSAPRGTRRSDPADPPATTALPVTNGRRQRPEPTGTRSRQEAENPEATVVVSAAGRTGGQDAEVPAASTRTRSVPSDASGAGRDAETHTRAMRIDETLTRMTAAHAGLTLAVTDRPAEEVSVPRPRRGAAATAGRLLAGALALMVLGTAAFGWGTKTWLGSAVRDAAALDPGSSAIVDATAQSGDENVLVVAAEPAADEAQPRADTVAVAHIPDGGGPVTVLAFPLDLEINRPPCERWDAGAMAYQEEPVQAEARTQLVSALDLGGPRCITRVVQQLSGLAITKYVGIDLGGVPAMTDAVGGAEVCVPRPVLDGVLGPVVPDAGMNELAGVRAADYVHAADVQGDPSAEYGRIERQQQVLAAVLDSAVSGTALMDVGRLAALRPTLSEAVLTDGAGIDQMLALAMTLRRLDTDGVQYAVVPTGERNSRGNAVLRDTDASALFSAVRADEPLPADATELDAGSAGPTPGEVTVEVINASARSGLAGEVSETLSSLGFDVGEPDSADQPSSETVIRFSPDQAAAAEVLRATVPSADSVPDPGSTGVLELVLGQSFDDVVRAPSEPIALAAPPSEPSAEPSVTCA